MKRVKSRKKIKVWRNDWNRYKRLFGVLLCILFVVLGFFAYQGFVFYQCKVENNRLVTLKNEYEMLVEEINNYRQLIGQYEIVLSDNSNLNNNKEELEKKVLELDNNIKNLESKIDDINKKIKNLS